MMTRRQNVSEPNTFPRLLELASTCLLSANGRALLSDFGERNGEDSPASSLVALLAGALDGPPAAIQAANELASKMSGESRGEDQQVAAAWDAFYRAAAASDQKILIHTLMHQRRAFDNLPLVQAVTKQFPIASESPLMDADMLACRHLMGSSVAELEAIQTALPRLRFGELLGKPYSANRLVVMELENRRIAVRMDSWVIGELSRQPFGAYARKHRVAARAVVQDFLERTGKSTAPLLVVDDGGALIDAVGQRVMSGEIERPVVAIEQTTHGLFAVRKFLHEPRAKRHGFAVIPVAESRTKLADESALIANSVVDKMEGWIRLLRESGQLRQRPKQIGIIGFGIVGMSIAKALKDKGSEVIAFDRNHRKAAHAQEMGCRAAWSLQDLIEECDLIVGASGGMSINARAALHLRPGTVLVSASSGDREFRGLANWDMSVQPLLPVDKSPTAFDLAHGLIVARDRQDGRAVYILNRGFPVNFDGSIDPIPTRDIQMTRALVVGAVLQAAGGGQLGDGLVGRTGEFGLHGALDRFVHDEFKKLRPLG